MKRAKKTPKNQIVVAHIPQHSLANPAHAARICQEIPLLRYVMEYVRDGVTMLNLSIGKHKSHVQEVLKNGDVKVSRILNLSYVQQTNHFNPYIDKLPEALQETTLSLKRLAEINELKAKDAEKDRTIAVMQQKLDIYDKLTGKGGS